MADKNNKCDRRELLEKLKKEKMDEITEKIESRIAELESDLDQCADEMLKELENTREYVFNEILCEKFFEGFQNRLDYFSMDDVLIEIRDALPIITFEPNESIIDMSIIGEFKVEQDIIETEICHDNGICMIKIPDYRIAFSSNSKLISIRDSSNMKLIKVLDEHQGNIQCLRLTSENRLLSSSKDGCIKIWDLSSYGCLRTLEIEKQVNCMVEISPKSLIISTEDREIGVIDLDANNNNFAILGESPYSFAILSKLSDNKFAAVLSNSRIKIWNSIDLNELGELNLNNSSINCIAVISNNRLVCGTDDNKISFWDLNNLSRIKEHEDSVSCLKVLNINTLASGTYDDTIKLWCLETYSCLRTYAAHSDPITCLLL